MIFDFHTHSLEGSNCSSIPIKKLVDELKKNKYDGAIITDHHSLDGYYYYKECFGDSTDFLLLRGFEFTTCFGDMLVILPNGKIIPYRKDVSPEWLIDRVREENGIIGIPHMFRDRKSIGYNLFHNKKRFNYIIENVDFIEVKNGGSNDEENLSAFNIAKKFNKFKTKGSDCHKLRDISGEYKNEINFEIKNEIDLINYVQDRNK